MIVDSQVHLWTAERPDRPWPPGGAERAQMPYPLTYPMMLELMDQAGVDGAIIVPPSWEGDRNDYALEAARLHPGRFAVMGRIDVTDPSNAGKLATWRSQPGMLGIRITFIGRLANALFDGSIDWLWPVAERAGIPIMMHTAGQQAALGPIAARHPGLTLIIDHMGLSHRIAEEGRTAEAIVETAKLASHRNIFVKLSAAPNYSHEAYPHKDLDPYIKRLVDAYGPARCFWGTDASHFFDEHPYLRRVTHFTEALDFLDADEKRLIMGEALCKVLGWQH
ncbi:MAG: hypothetical protein RLZ98_2753 [Pseudomonadota bacterium]|jgi:predicted TIM-barrel fold metal-dependent hydrolase